MKFTNVVIYNNESIASLLNNAIFVNVKKHPWNDIHRFEDLYKDTIYLVKVHYVTKFLRVFQNHSLLKIESDDRIVVANFIYDTKTIDILNLFNNNDAFQNMCDKLGFEKTIKFYML